jgi:hypothetical protein
MFLRSHRSQASERSFGTARIEPCQSSAVCFLALRLFPYGLSVTSGAVREALAHDSFRRALGAFHVVHAKPNAIVIPEIEFGQVAVQVFFLAVLVDAFHAALENREVAFGGIGVNGHGLAARKHFDVGIADVLFVTVVDRVMHAEPLSGLGVPASLIGHEHVFLGDVGPEHFAKGAAGGAVDMEAAGRTATLDEGQDDVLMATAGAGLGHALYPPEVGFIRFHDLASPAHGLDADRPHGLPDTVRHEPGSLEGDAQGAVKLVAGNALLGRAQQVHRLDPETHGDVAGFEDGPDLDGELLAALVALVQPDPGGAAGHLADALDPAAMGANRPLRPHMGFNPSVSGGFVVEGLGFDHRFGHDTRFPFMIQGYPAGLGLSSTIFRS